MKIEEPYAKRSNRERTYNNLPRSPDDQSQEVFRYPTQHRYIWPFLRAKDLKETWDTVHTTVRDASFDERQLKVSTISTYKKDDSHRFVRDLEDGRNLIVLVVVRRSTFVTRYAHRAWDTQWHQHREKGRDLCVSPLTRSERNWQDALFLNMTIGHESRPNWVRLCYDNHWRHSRDIFVWHSTTNTSRS